MNQKSAVSLLTFFLAAGIGVATGACNGDGGTPPVSKPYIWASCDGDSTVLEYCVDTTNCNIPYYLQKACAEELGGSYTDYEDKVDSTVGGKADCGGRPLIEIPGCNGNGSGNASDTDSGSTTEQGGTTNGGGTSGTSGGGEQWYSCENAGVVIATKKACFFNPNSVSKTDIGWDSKNECFPADSLSDAKDLCVAACRNALISIYNYDIGYEDCLISDFDCEAFCADA